MSACPTRALPSAAAHGAAALKTVEKASFGCGPTPVTDLLHAHLRAQIEHAGVLPFWPQILRPPAPAEVRPDAVRLLYFTAVPQSPPSPPGTADYEPATDARTGAQVRLYVKLTRKA
jgi:hypothetical protein